MSTIAAVRGRTALAVAIVLVLLSGIVAAATMGGDDHQDLADDESVLTAAYASMVAEAERQDAADARDAELAAGTDAETTTTTTVATTTAAQTSTTATTAPPAPPATPPPTSPPPTSPPATAPPQPPPTTVPSGGSNNPKASECESAMIQWVNEARAAAGVHPLTPKSNLSGLARTWSTHLANTGKLAHQDQNHILRLLGASAARENVGQASTSARSIFDNFMASPTHRDNILATNVSQIGVGCVYAGPRVWVTQTFIG